MKGGTQSEVLSWGVLLRGLQAFCLCLSLFSIAPRKTRTKATSVCVCCGEGDRYLDYTFRSQPITEGNQGRNSRWESGTEAETVKEGYLQACSAWLAQLEDFFFFLLPRTTGPGLAAHTVGQTLPSSSHIHHSGPGLPQPLPQPSLIKEMPHQLAYAPSWWRHFLSWGAAFPYDSAEVKLMKTLRSPGLTRVPLSLSSGPLILDLKL